MARVYWGMNEGEIIIMIKNKQAIEELKQTEVHR